MLDLLIIEHESESPPGTAIQWAQENGLSYEIWHIDKDATPPFQATQVKAVLICGGSMDTCEEEKFPWLKVEKKFIQQCLALKKPLFGLCLGSQLVAEALGGKVYSMKKWEIGFIPIKLLEQDRILHAFHWHQYTFDLPLGAELIATNDFCVNQAFKYEDHIIATQFHPEATIEWVQECADSIRKEPLEGLVQTADKMLQDMTLQKLQQNWFFEQLTKWYSVS